MKHFINIRDIPSKDLKKIILDAKKRKSKRKNLNTLDPDKDSPLQGNLLIQMFEKSSLRTRLSFYTAIKQLSGGSLTLRPDELHLSKGRESLEDTAKIISTFGNAFMLRTDSDRKLEEFKKYMTIPIINGLSPSSHPTQVLSDVFTIEEIMKKSISKLQICWIGDANNNVINSLIEASVKFSFKLNIGCPKKYEPKKSLLNWAKKNKGKIKIFDNIKKAALSSDVLFTDKVISMNDKVNKSKKLKDFKKFKITSKVMNYLKKSGIFLHCLPRGSEVSNDVFLSKQSKVWEQALNRIYVQKSILLYCFEKLR
jgi:ornithine carbamoyltransferase